MINAVHQIVATWEAILADIGALRRASSSGADRRTRLADGEEEKPIPVPPSESLPAEVERNREVVPPAEPPAFETLEVSLDRCKGNGGF